MDKLTCVFLPDRPTPFAWDIKDTWFYGSCLCFGPDLIELGDFAFWGVV